MELQTIIPGTWKAAMCWDKYLVESVGVRPMNQEQQVDWRQCDLVESVPNKLGGEPVLKGTRMPAQGIVDNYDDGMTPAEIAEAFELPMPVVTGILEWVWKHRASSAG